MQKDKDKRAIDIIEPWYDCLPFYPLKTDVYLLIDEGLICNFIQKVKKKCAIFATYSHIS